MTPHQVKPGDPVPSWLAEVKNGRATFISSAVITRPRIDGPFVVSFEPQQVIQIEAIDPSRRVTFRGMRGGVVLSQTVAPPQVFWIGPHAGEGRLGWRGPGNKGLQYRSRTSVPPKDPQAARPVEADSESSAP